MRKLLNLSFLVFIGLTFSVFGQNRELVQEDSKTEQKPEQKFALVIGNSAYESSPLKNPVNDARAISQTLTALGFQVILKENINQVEMKRAVREFGDKIKNGGIGLFYFAGHGVQVKGQNYLVPIGAQITKEEEAEYEGLDVGFVMAQMEAAKNRMNIVILDACRNNPFARSFRSESNGLASISAPSGTLIAYATAPGSVASDGSGENGLYTQELLFNMKTVGLNIEEVFKRVRIAVREKTQNKQTPWESSSLTGDFYFAKSGEVKALKNEQIQIPSNDSTAVEIAYWNSIKDSRDIGDFKGYLAKYPNGQFSDIANRKIQNVDTFKLATNNNTSDIAASLNLLKTIGSIAYNLGKPGGFSTTIEIIEPCQLKVELRARIVFKGDKKKPITAYPQLDEIIIKLKDLNIARISASNDWGSLGIGIWYVSVETVDRIKINHKSTVYKVNDESFSKIETPSKLYDSTEAMLGYFQDAETSNRFAKTLAEASRLCGAKSETF